MAPPIMRRGKKRLMRLRRRAYRDGRHEHHPAVAVNDLPEVRASLTHTEQTLLMRGEALREAPKWVGRRSAKAPNRR